MSGCRPRAKRRGRASAAGRGRSKGAGPPLARQTDAKLTAFRVMQSWDETACCVWGLAMAGRTGDVGVYIPEAEPDRCVGFIICHDCGRADLRGVEQRLAERPGLPFFVEGGPRGEAQRAREEALCIAQHNQALIERLLSDARGRGVVDPVVFLLGDRDKKLPALACPQAQASDLLLRLRPRAVKVAKRLRERAPTGATWLVVDTLVTDHTVSILVLPALASMGGSA